MSLTCNNGIPSRFFSQYLFQRRNMSILKLGKLLMERRGEEGIREFAKKLGISPATLSRIENGKLPDLRSEEHTSELQSRENLVCRLLLEKKKKKQKN